MADDDYSPEDAVRMFPSMRFKTDSPLKSSTAFKTIPSLKMDPDRVYAIMNLDQSKLPPIPDPDDVAGAGENTFLHYHHHRDPHADFNPAKIFQMDRNSSDFFFPKEKCWYIFDQDSDQYLVPALLIIFGLISLVGNAFVFVSFVSSRRLRTGQNLMLLNISIADVIYVFSLVPVTLLSYAVDNGSPFQIQPTTCRSAYYVIFVTVYVTMYTLVVACFFRFSNCLWCRGRDPRKGNTRSLTLCNAGILCLVVWIAFVLSHVKLLIQSQPEDGGPAYANWKYFLCHLDDHTWSGANGDVKQVPATGEMKTLWIIFLTCAFIVPILIIAFFAGLVLRRGQSDLTSSMSVANHRAGMTRSQSQAHHYETIQNQENDARRKKELTLVVVATALIRFVCWLPVLCVAIVIAFNPQKTSQSGSCQEGSSLRRAELFGVCMTIVATCCTAFIYCGLVEDFKQWAWSCLGGRRRGKHAHNRVNIGTVLGNNATLTLNGVKMAEMNETIMSIITDSSNHINYAG